MINYYVQCRMRKLSLSKGVSYYIGWLPEKLAKKGRHVRLKIDGEWEGGWEIIDVWERKSSIELRTKKEEKEEEEGMT